eukprot:gnl/TRDRNA2_/TRDRNA2_32380_c0_seq1.p1 gnl/TRDRNA2_/TRDRNA2_32380_c0~~gnl/TRDRNA2_/TRDRNA2_32380_c0_seq1.p1  ORF type:complete len:559 (+),score=105.08 gnl/TRDRNA2_/TRDRNA2_32380_c0_seq1:2-1678(+)
MHHMVLMILLVFVSSKFRCQDGTLRDADFTQDKLLSKYSGDLHSLVDRELLVLKVQCFRRSCLENTLLAKAHSKHIPKCCDCRGRCVCGRCKTCSSDVKSISSRRLISSAFKGTNNRFSWKKDDASESREIRRRRRGQDDDRQREEVWHRRRGASRLPVESVRRKHSDDDSDDPSCNQEDVSRAFSGADSPFPWRGGKRRPRQHEADDSDSEEDLPSKQSHIYEDPELEALQKKVDDFITDMPELPDFDAMLEEAPDEAAEKKHVIANTIDPVPNMIYGTAWKKHRTAELVELAFSKGFRAFDTANIPKDYDEGLVGAALQKLMSSGRATREELWIQTKFSPAACAGQPKHLHPYDEYEDIPTQVRQSFSSSLDHLGLSYVDSLLLQQPYNHDLKNLEAWREMENIHREGKARQIGVSNFDKEQLEWLLEQADVSPAFVQNRCLHNRSAMLQSVAPELSFDLEVRDFCELHGIRYQGTWLLTGNMVFTGRREVVRMSLSKQMTKQQVMFQYAIQGLKIIPLTGTKQAVHMEEDLAVAAGEKTLKEKELETLTSLAQRR